MLLGAVVAFVVEKMGFDFAAVAAEGERESGEAVVGSGKLRALVSVRKKCDKEKQEEKKTEIEARVAGMWRFDLSANSVPLFAGIPSYRSCSFSTASCAVSECGGARLAGVAVEMKDDVR